MKINHDMARIQKLVGEIKESDLKYVDCYVSDGFGIFIPSVGFCQYAITPQHTHPSYSFVLFFSKEQSIVPVRIEVLPEHYLMVGISPGVPHEEDETDTFTRYMAIFISQELFQAQYEKYHAASPEKYNWDQFLVEQDVMFYLKNFMTEYENRLPGSQMVLDALAKVITHKIVRGILKVIVTGGVSITEKMEMERVIEFMHQHFWQKLSLASLAKIAGMSESHFTRSFKKQTGLAPMEYLIRMRIDKGKILLRSGTKNITEISLQCGFSSLSHFSSSFIKHMGMTPSEYQKTYGD